MGKALDFLLPWDSQPQEAVGVDWSNPLTRDLLVSLPLSAASGYTSIGKNKIAGVATAASTGTTPVGTALKLSATGHIALGTACLLPSATTPFTMALYELPDATSAYSSLVGLSGGGQQLLWIRGTTAAYYCSISAANFGSVQNFASVGVPVVGVGRRFLVTSIGGIQATSGYRLWMDGVEQTSSPFTVYGSVASSTNYIGWDGADTKFNGKLQDFNLWGRVLSDAEIQEYFRAPWQLLAPRTIQIPVSAGGGGTSISGALGTASASGLAATVNANRTIAAALGTASASGFQATVSNSTDTTISGALGTASAIGYQATVDNSNDTTVNGSLGTAAASGFTATVNANRTIAAGLGAAAASGFQAGVTNDNSTTINGALGTAVASGFTAGLNVNRTVLCSVGEALALGHQATIQGGGAIAVTGGGGWLPSMRRKTRKQIHDERVRLGILPADVVKAAKKAAAVVADEPAPVMAYKADPEQANKVFMRSLGVSKMLPDYTRAIEAQIKVRQREEEDLMLFM